VAEHFDALILSLETRAGLAAARSLGRGGYRIAVATWGRKAPGLRTRYAAARLVLPHPDEGASECATALHAWLERNPTDVVLTSTDTGLTVLHEHRELLAPHARLAIASPSAIDQSLSKQRTLEVAERLGIPYPTSIVARTSDEAEAALVKLGLPAVIKPFQQWHRSSTGLGDLEKPRLLETPEEAQRAVRELVGPETPVLVQEVVGDGIFEHHQFFRADGRVIARVTLGVDRQWPPYGISAMRMTIEPPADTGPWSEALVEAIDIEGCSSVQFKRDRKGRPYLMEVNARLVQTLGVAALAGIDFARLQLEWARGGPLDSPAAPRVGVRVGWLSGDLHLLAAAGSLVDVKPKPLLGPTVRGVAGDYLLGRARVEGFDLRDPKPMLASIGEATVGFGRMFRTRLGRRSHA
jgi:predicted ATP-grasp superfamily ATP-dependent carboligase